MRRSELRRMGHDEADAVRSARLKGRFGRFFLEYDKKSHNLNAGI